MSFPVLSKYFTAIIANLSIDSTILVAFSFGRKYGLILDIGGKGRSPPPSPENIIILTAVNTYYHYLPIVLTFTLLRTIDDAHTLFCMPILYILQKQ